MSMIVFEVLKKGNKMYGLTLNLISIHKLKTLPFLT